MVGTFLNDECGGDVEGYFLSSLLLSAWSLYCYARLKAIVLVT